MATTAATFPLQVCSSWLPQQPPPPWRTVSPSRSFSGGTASARAATATTGGRCPWLLQPPEPQPQPPLSTEPQAGAACVAVTHEVHAEVGEVTQVAREGVASTGAEMTMPP